MLMEIDNEVVGILWYYYFFLWLVFFLLEVEEDDWMLLYNKFDLDVVSIIFEDKRNDVGSFVLCKVIYLIVIELCLCVDV